MMKKKKKVGGSSCVDQSASQPSYCLELLIDQIDRLID